MLVALAIAGTVSAAAEAATPPRADTAPEPAKIQAGAYLAARAAQQEYDWQTASLAMGRVLYSTPDDARLRHDTMLFALAAGDIKTALQVASTIPAGTDDAPLAALLQAVDAVARGDRSAESRAAALPVIGLNRYAQPLLRAWLASGTGTGKERNKEAEALLQPLAKMDGAESIFALHAGFLAAAAGHGDEARGRFERARAVAMAPQIASLAELGLTGTAKALPANARAGIAQGLSDLAQLLLTQRHLDAALLYARLSLHLAPAQPTAWLVAGDVAARRGRAEEALAAYEKIAADSFSRPVAERAMVDCLNRLGRTEEALAMAKAQATSRARDVDAQLKLGDLLRRQSRYDGAVDAYTRALELLPQGSDRRWVVLYARGASAERTGAWDAAERDLQQALVLKPDTPTLLNFLGFAWAERGIQLQQARTMLQRASTMAPDDGAIADSLGWVMYRMGEFEPAVAELERAVALQPADGTINDHLGDAYWRVGRRREAQFQWERAAVQAEDPQLANRIRAKLAQGLAHLTPTPLLPGEGLGH